MSIVAHADGKRAHPQNSLSSGEVEGEIEASDQPRRDAAHCFNSKLMQSVRVISGDSEDYYPAWRGSSNRAHPRRVLSWRA